MTELAKAIQNLKDELIKAKYIRRIPKAGGGYKYIYKQKEHEKVLKQEYETKLSPKQKQLYSIIDKANISKEYRERLRDEIDEFERNDELDTYDINDLKEAIKKHEKK